MTQHDKELASVTLNIENWRATQAVIKDGCWQRGGDWPSWGAQKVAQIQAAIDVVVEKSRSTKRKNGCPYCGSSNVHAYPDDLF